MNRPHPPRRRARVRAVLLLLALLVIAGAGGWWYTHRDKPDSGPYVDPVVPAAEIVPADEADVKKFCSSCHGFAPPDSFPRFAWRREVKMMYDFLGDWPERLTVAMPPMERVIKYYQSNAPAELAIVPPTRNPGPCPVRLEPHRYPGLQMHNPDIPAISYLGVVRLLDSPRPQLLACDMRQGRVMLMKPDDPQPRWQVLAEIPNPAHAEVVDLDGDGIKDLVVANLGNFSPTDDKVGSVVWLRGKADGTFTPITLLDKVGRVADVQVADFNGDGKKDLVVAVFGWHMTGEITYLENRTTDWSHPRFVPHLVDGRHGAIHVPVADLNGDGKPDFVALISQEHETVVAYLNDGKGEFTPKEIFKGPHPAWGSSGIQLVDLNGDGKLDVLMSNGDVMDSPLLFPYHGVRWLENRGTYPFTPHLIGPLYGVHRAVAADFDGHGLADVVAVSYLPQSLFPERDERNLDAVVLYRQTAPGQFTPYVLESRTCDHVSCTVGDLYGDGRQHLVVGNLFVNITDEPYNRKDRRSDDMPPFPRVLDSITVWKNLTDPGRRRAR